MFSYICCVSLDEAGSVACRTGPTHALHRKGNRVKGEPLDPKVAWRQCVPPPTPGWVAAPKLESR